MAAAVPPQFSSFLAESVLPGYKTSYVRSKDVIAKLDREKWERIWTLQTGRLVGCRNEGNKSSAGHDGVLQPVLAVHPSSGEPTLCYNQAPPRVGKMQLVGDGDGEDEMVNVSIDPSLPRAEKEQQLQRRVEALKEDPETQRRLDDQTSSLHEEMNDAIRRTGDVMHNEWGKGDLVLIDNLALLHTANPSLQAYLHSQMVERGERLPVRLLQRTTVCAGKEAQEKGLESLRRSDRRSIKTRV
uniref:Uncharacterized protein n=1 Tax=Chromera velia CCMP2878 TaxID=1169474 RepID=A0A0G4GQA0_9ALVE|eukprot:Cvel_22894.t1-p1 / transcript=Cvel_22894.t1 / gene=Cvel_22894 / organism=Chromera_velia_CCMP2878 / gene_product=hypothetical protein / transcript_product=hypothetical protein / location=Cvel_scaffold2300:10878-12866(-) / protein_length=241 / sequence_SO=supercontig / SO=protein_coding / is_pseudo=false